MKKEQNYDFRKRMLQIHRKDVRDYEVLPGPDELVIHEGFAVVLPSREELGALGLNAAGDPMDELVIETAARDFVDYLFTSMGISAFLLRRAESWNINAVRLKLNRDLGEASSPRSYRITVGEGILLEGYDANGIAQGLYHLEDIMNLRMAPYLPMGTQEHKVLFPIRQTMSGYGVDMYPDEYLCRLAHEGITSLTLWTLGKDKTRIGYVDFNDLGYRAAKYGIDLYVESYIHHNVHPDDEGAEEFYDNIYGTLVRECPYIKGIIVEGEISQFASRDPRVGKSPKQANYIDGIPTGKPSPGWWPCCDWPDLMRMIQKVVNKVRPGIDLVLCSYNWGWADEEERIKLINALPDGISIMATWEMFEHYDLNGCDEVICDYSIRTEGPGEYFRSEAKAATDRGLMVHSISCTTGRTWDFGVIPYMPAPYQWIKRYENMRDAHEEYYFRGLLEAHHYGVYPSFVTELEKWAFTTPRVDLEDTLRKILASRYGKDNMEYVDQALRIWSDAFTYAIPSNEDQYGAFRIGPSYPFWTSGGCYPPQEEYAMFKATGMYNLRYTPCQDGSPCSVRIGEELKSIEKMRDLILDGLEILERIPKKNEELEFLINMGWFMYRITITGIHAKQFYMAWTRCEAEADRRKKYDALTELEEILMRERENAELTIPLVELDSILGYEPSMEYTTDPKRIRWKLRQVDYELSRVREMKDSCFKKINRRIGGI